jgi:hypothetical protein
VHSVVRVWCSAPIHLASPSSVIPDHQGNRSVDPRWGVRQRDVIKSCDDVRRFSAILEPRRFMHRRDLDFGRGIGKCRPRVHVSPPPPLFVDTSPDPALSQPRYAHIYRVQPFEDPSQVQGLSNRPGYKEERIIAQPVIPELIKRK